MHYVNSYLKKSKDIKQFKKVNSALDQNNLSIKANRNNKLKLQKAATKLSNKRCFKQKKNT